MIRLYFHIREGDRLSRDPEGAEFQDVQTAHTEAVRSARELLSQRVLNGEEIDGQSFELTDESGAVVDTVKFRDVLRLHQG
ncbi:hypothetical protein [Neorhizobium sp. NCHU2750]|uniref:DUF6894 family protein n=1 Tax=Neorhizobium sp. NCHU2750 TaxID=1825976 RepID=UPI000E760FA9|nr:hypothetical protein NCHU2750_52430 [Neorhizobium sp. NCHU2750]